METEGCSITIHRQDNLKTARNSQGAIILQNLSCKINCSASFVDQMQIVCCFSPKITVPRLWISAGFFIQFNKIQYWAVLLGSCKDLFVVRNSQCKHSNMMVRTSYIIQCFLKRHQNLISTIKCITAKHMFQYSVVQVSKPGVK